MLFEIVGQTREKVVFAHETHEHKHEAGAFGINNGAIKEGGDFSGIFDFAFDGLDTGQTVASKGRDDGTGVKIVPGAEIGADFISSISLHERGKGFVEPEVVPPSHRNKIAEPHMGEFVGDDEGDVEFLVEGGALATE